MEKVESQTLAFDIFLTPEGAENIAKGKEAYSWNFRLSLFETEEIRQDWINRHNLTWLKTIKVNMPSAEVARVAAERALQKKLEEVRAEAYKEEQGVIARISELQSLTYEASND